MELEMRNGWVDDGDGAGREEVRSARQSRGRLFVLPVLLARIQERSSDRSSPPWAVDSLLARPFATVVSIFCRCAPRRCVPCFSRLFCSDSLCSATASLAEDDGDRRPRE